jgi:hypothetical protein
MATAGSSNTTIFNLDLTDLIEEAGERCGIEIRAGHQVRTARRSLNLLLAEWANRGINLWTLEQQERVLIPGVGRYILPADTVDLLEAVIRTGTGVSRTDLSLNRISASVYSTIPNKYTQGRPFQMWMDRQAIPDIVLWPVPDSSAVYTLVYWRLRRLQDAGNGLNTQDIPFRFLPAMTAGLAYHMAIKIPEARPLLPVLKAQYDEAWMLAADEDREKSPVRFVPRICS